MSRNLGTTTTNKKGFYVGKFHGRTAYLLAVSLYAGLSQALSHYPEVARLVGVEKPKAELDTVLERIGGMTEANREALLSALRDQPDGEGKKTG